MFKFLLLFGLFCSFVYRIFPFLMRIFGSNRGRQQSYNQNQHSSYNDSKRFKKDIGEYVPYEEVKDDEK